VLDYHSLASLTQGYKVPAEFFTRNLHSGFSRNLSLLITYSARLQGVAGLAEEIERMKPPPVLQLRFFELAEEESEVEQDDRRA